MGLRLLSSRKTWNGATSLRVEVEAHSRYAKQLYERGEHFHSRTSCSAYIHFTHRCTVFMLNIRTFTYTQFTHPCTVVRLKIRAFTYIQFTHPYTVVMLNIRTFTCIQFTHRCTVVMLNIRTFTYIQFTHRCTVVMLNIRIFTYIQFTHRCTVVMLSIRTFPYIQFTHRWSWSHVFILFLLHSTSSVIIRYSFADITLEEVNCCACRANLDTVTIHIFVWVKKCETLRRVLNFFPKEDNNRKNGSKFSVNL